ncbi:MAG TPA: YetF domain-containing protein [Chitinophagales bacterium]|nr:YetF domain-containing protein [Chitinophagales bacterium]
MNPVLRGVVIYLFLLIIFRIMGKRHMSETTTFDLVILLIISEVTQEALVGEDYSLTASMILICTLMGSTLVLSLLKEWFPSFDRVAESVPLVVVDNGKPLKKRMKKAQVDEDDVLNAARMVHGLERMEDIKYAVLEKDGNISIVPMEK